MALYGPSAHLARLAPGLGRPDSAAYSGCWAFHNPYWEVTRLNATSVYEWVKPWRLEGNMSAAAKTDLIRLSLLADYGGVWADATMLCGQPLDNWVHDAVDLAGFWMYHSGKMAEAGGRRATAIDSRVFEGAANWFIVSVARSPVIQHWRLLADAYWTAERRHTGVPHDYLWMPYLWEQQIAAEKAGVNTTWRTGSVNFTRAWALVPKVVARYSYRNTGLLALCCGQWYMDANSGHGASLRAQITGAAGLPRAIKLAYRSQYAPCYKCTGAARRSRYNYSLLEYAVDLSLSGQAQPGELAGNDSKMWWQGGIRITAAHKES